MRGRRVYGRTPPAERFWKHVDVRGPDECWPWLGTTSDYGHGRFWDGHYMKPAHVFAYELVHGSLPADKPCGLHRCDNPPCCNERHVFPGTRGDNARDMAAKGRNFVPALSGARHPLVKDPSRAARGEDHGMALLNSLKVGEIRAAYALGAQITHLARRFNVARSTVCRVVRRETWKHVP